MKLMLQLQNRINESQKHADRQLHEAQQERDTEINKIRKVGNEKIHENDVMIDEKREENMSMKEIARKKSIYESMLWEWGQQCLGLQQKITKTKYENQIEMARMKQQIESEFEESLGSFKQLANQDANRSKVAHVIAYNFA